MWLLKGGNLSALQVPVSDCLLKGRRLVMNGKGRALQRLIENRIFYSLILAMNRLGIKPLASFTKFMIDINFEIYRLTGWMSETIVAF